MKSKLLLPTLTAIVSLCCSVTDAQVKLKTQTWANNPTQFKVFEKEITKNHQINLLTFPGAKLVRSEAVDSPQMLVDGLAGNLGGHGRVAVHGSPSRIVYYLGKPRTISEIRVCTGNIDQRGNQDFEIRLVDNCSEPGKEPSFHVEPTLTSGDKVLGANGGGVMSVFSNPKTENASKKLFGDQKYDWIEFRIWKTYPNGRGGAPAKSENKSDSWASVIELQVLGDVDDPELFSSEAERQMFLARIESEKLQNALDALGSEVAFAMKKPSSLRKAIEDLSQKFPDEFRAEEFLKEYEAFEKELNAPNWKHEDILDLAKRFAEFRRKVLLSNPLLKFDELLFRRAQNPGLEANWISNAARGKGNYGNALMTVNPTDPTGKLRTVVEGPQGSFIGDIALHWNADRMLVTALAEDRTWQVFELNVDGTGMKQVSPSMGSDIDNVEGCYVADGSHLFISTASMMGVPCIDGSSQVGNIYRVEEDGKTVRQLTFEQDQDWCPVSLPNGRIMYLRWEYTDTPHYFTRILFSMNPDGTNQVEHYGSGSFWPNSLFYAKPIPNHPSKFVGIVSGHHGVARMGELVVFDPGKGRKEADGVIGRIPNFKEKVEPIIDDQLVDNSWPKFLFPYPLDENYFLVSAQIKPSDPWGLYLVDTFDNMLLLRQEEGYWLLEPTPIVKRQAPPVVLPRVDPDQTESTVFITDIYMGDGLKDVPRGTVKKLRIFEYSFGYRGIGGHDCFGMESSWDAKRILGEVPVYEDGSAMFTIPANTPIALQPLDEKGRAMQLMRSWLLGMPGEVVSCIGCHEPQNMVTPAKSTIARTKRPTPIQPFFGSARPFTYEAEIQPVLDKYCVGCHDGSEENKNLPNLADKNKGPMSFSNSYHALARFVRRPGPESDTYMFKPMEYHASSSELFQKLEKGHHGVKLDDESFRKLYTWVDLNVPYFGTWLEVAENHRGQKRAEQMRQINARYVELKEMYANIKLDYEEDSYLGEKQKTQIQYVQPEELPTPDYTAPKLANWPFAAETAKKIQSDGVSSIYKTIPVADGIELNLVRIPAGRFVIGDGKQGQRDELPRSEAVIEKPFWMLNTEVSNSLYNQFDPQHDSRYIDQWNKDHTTPGYPANKPEQPVIRVSWNEATAFCKWLSEKTGQRFRLPSESEWEWAARAGTDTPMWYGSTDTDFSQFENLADESTRRFVVAGVNPQPVQHQDWQAFIPRANGVNDGQMIAEKVAAYQANPWGLYDMLGSVSEWTSSDYKSYPASFVQSSDPQNDPSVPKVVRGGSWKDRPKQSRSGIRRYYEPWQKVHNVGFRVIMLNSED